MGSRKAAVPASGGRELQFRKSEKIVSNQNLDRKDRSSRNCEKSKVVFKEEEGGGERAGRVQQQQEGVHVHVQEGDRAAVVNHRVRVNFEEGGIVITV